MQDEVKVTHADREAAWPYAGFHCLPDRQMHERWFSGYYDNLGQGQAIRDFARHRHQAERDTLARIEWMDIESAPKDWTDVLVFSPEHEGFNCGGVFSAFYDTDEACWFTHAPGHNIRLNPTHWMPLPPAPEAGQ